MRDTSPIQVRFCNQLSRPKPLASLLSLSSRAAAAMARLVTALPPGASTSREELTPSPAMGGFELAFHLPFDRCSVYDELLIHPRRGHPLGASPNVAFSVIRPGYEAHEEMSVGCVRKVTFAQPFYGMTTSELAVASRGDPDAEEGISELVWRQLQSSTRLNLLGDGQHPPEFGVVLEGGPAGTLVTMRYNFARAQMDGPLCLLVGCMPALLRWHLHASISSVWHLEMVSAAHAPRRPLALRCPVPP